MADLVERLKNPTWANCTHDGVMEEAATELERLRDALSKINGYAGAYKDGQGSAIDRIAYIAEAAIASPRFDKTYCSQCGGEFGPGNHGYSHCEDHKTSPTREDGGSKDG